jgi:hypothetical protein
MALANVQQLICSINVHNMLNDTLAMFQLRGIAIYVSVNQYFDYLVMLTILANCAFLAMTEPINEAE